MPNLVHFRALYPSPTHGLAGNVKTAHVELAVGTADLTVNSVHRVWKTPAGATVIGALIRSTDIDTNVSPAVVLTLGDATDDDRLMTNVVVGQTGTASATIAATGIGYKYTAETDILLKVGTAPGTAAAGTITVIITYSIYEE